LNSIFKILETLLIIEDKKAKMIKVKINAGILKALEVSVGLALPKDASISFK